MEISTKINQNSFVKFQFIQRPIVIRMKEIQFEVELLTLIHKIIALWILQAIKKPDK